MSGPEVSGPAHRSELAARGPAQLIQDIATRHDRDALALLFGEFAGRIKNFYICRGVPDAEAEELTIRTFVSVWQRAASFQRQQGDAETWLYVVARDGACQAGLSMARPRTH